MCNQIGAEVNQCQAGGFGLQYLPFKFLFILELQAPVFNEEVNILQ